MTHWVVTAISATKYLHMGNSLSDREIYLYNRTKQEQNP